MKSKLIIIFLLFSVSLFGQRTKMKYSEVTDTLKFGTKVTTGVYVTGATIDSTKLLHAGVLSSVGKDTAYFYPESYGAVVNDGTDDRAAIQAAIDAACAKGGGIVWLSKGEYKITTSVSRGSYESGLHLCSYVSLQGQGWQCVIKSTLTTAGKHIISTPSLATNIKILDLQIKSDSLPSGAAIFSQSGVSNVFINRIKIDRGTCWGILLNQSHDCIISDSDIQNGGVCHCIEINNSNNMILRNNNLYSNCTRNYAPARGNAIETFFNDATEGRPYSNIIEGNNCHNTGGGITIWGDSLTKVVNNTLREITGIGIGVTTEKDFGDTTNNVGILIMGNIIANCGFTLNTKSGILIESGNEDIQIIGNTIDSIYSNDAGQGGGNGIQNEAKGTIIKGNTISHCYVAGISSTGANCVITDNYIYDTSVLTANGFHGISVSGNRCIINNNSVHDYRGTHRIDICIYSGSNDNVIVGNNCSGAATGDAIYNSGTGNVEANNKEN